MSIDVKYLDYIQCHDGANVDTWIADACA